MFLIYFTWAIVGVCALYYYFTRTFNYWKDRNVVGPKPLPIFGNLLNSALRRHFHGMDYKSIYDQYPNEKVVGIYRMTTPCVLVRDLEVIKHVMIKDFDVFVDRGVEFSKKGLGSNLFHADGDTWRVLRNRFTPLFTSGKLKNMSYLLTERVDKFANYVKNEVLENQEQEVHKLIQLYTLITISACAFGLDVDIGAKELELLKSFDKNIFTASFFMEFDMMYPGVLKKLNLSIFGPTVRSFFGDLVKNVVSERNNAPSGRKDFMDLILELRQQHNIEGSRRYDNEKLQLEITEDIIAAQAFVFYAAGYETSATTMSFMLFHLAKNQDIQDKLIAEIEDVLQNNDGQITYDSVKQMTYMNQVFDETLRLYPIVDVLQRNAQSDYQMPGTNVKVKKGQTVLLSTTGIHYDPKYYPNPYKFDPERFNVENSKDRHPCAYLPFGTGPRNCIGMRFAKLQSKVCISKLLSKFRVTPSKNTPERIDYDPCRVIIGPKDGILLNFEPRS